MGIPKKRSRKRTYGILAAVCGVMILGAGAAVIGISSRPKAEETSGPVTEPGEENQFSGFVVYKGETYKYKEHLSNFLFLGIDRREKADTALGKGDAGQADSIFLVSWDRVSQDITWITIPRDTMTEIQIYDQEGNPAGTSRDHINLAYAFGEGGEESCRLMEEAVSNLFYGLPVQGCCALHMDALPLLTETVGGLRVKVPNKSLESLDPRWKQGAEIQLDAQNTESFVRYRDTTESQSALDRMERQKVFLKAFGEKVQEEWKGNPSVVTELYPTLEPYMVTDMGKDQFVKLVDALREKGIAADWTLPGEGREGEDFDEFYPDDSKLYENILETFYIKEPV